MAQSAHHLQDVIWGGDMVIGYVRVSKEAQDVKNQRHELLEYANRRGVHIDEFVELEMPSRRDTKARRIDELLDRLHTGDMLIVSELSRAGRSVIEIISLVNSLIKKRVRFVAIKEGLE